MCRSRSKHILPSRHEGHSDEVAGDSVRGEPSQARTHAYAELHPRELQQQNKNTEDLDIVRNLRAYGNAIIDALPAGRCRETQLIEPPVHRTIVQLSRGDE